MSKAGGITYLIKHGRAAMPTVTRTEMPRVKKMASGGATTEPANAPLNYGAVPDYIFKPRMLATPDIVFDEKGRPIYKSGTYEVRAKAATEPTPLATYDPLAALAQRQGGGGLDRTGGAAGNGTNFTDAQWGTIKQMNDQYGMAGNPVNQTSFKAALSAVSPALAKMLGMYQNPLDAQQKAIDDIRNYEGSMGINAAVQSGYDVGPSANSRAARDAADAANAERSAVQGGFSVGPSENSRAARDAAAGSSGNEGRGSPGEGNQGGGYSGAGNDRDAVGGLYKNGQFDQKPKKMADGGIAALAAGGHSQGPRLLRGGGDGLSDGIPAVIGKGQPARLADGEFVVSADVVSALGGGSTEAGARKLYAMMDRIRHSAHGTKKQVKKLNEKKVLPA